MSLVKPQRSKGENTFDWISRRDSYRIEIMESQIKELQKTVKRLENKK